MSAPLAGVALALAGPAWLRRDRRSSPSSARRWCFWPRRRDRRRPARTALLSRLVDEGILVAGLRTLHPRFGTPSRLIDATAVVQMGIVLRLRRGSRRGWRASTPSAWSWSALLKTIALIRFRALRPGGRAYRVPINVTVGGRRVAGRVVADRGDCSALPALCLLLVPRRASLSPARCCWRR